MSVLDSVEPVAWRPPLARGEGFALCTAFEALLKGLLECELPVAQVLSPRRPPLEGIFRAVSDERSAEVLERHALRLVPAVDAARGVSLAVRSSAMGRRSLVCVPNDQLDIAMAAAWRDGARDGSAGGRAVLLLEDNPYLVPGACPVRAARALGLPCLAPSDLHGLRVAVQDAFRMADASGTTVALAVHVGLLRSLDTLELQPNRVLDRVDVALEMRRQRRWTAPSEGEPALQVGRRLELNRLLSLPSPGELEPWGVIAVGPCVLAARHLLGELGLAGRVPMLTMGLANPVDHASVLRLLGRCANVLVLEPRPGSVADELLQVAEEGRRSGERVASLWWSELPSDGAEIPTLEINDGVRPSILARKVVHLLERVRPGEPVEQRLSRTDARLEAWPVPDRGEGLGASGAIAAVRGMVREVAEELADRVPAPDEPATAVWMPGMPAPEAERIAAVEIWDRRRFVAEGVGAVRQGAREVRPRVLVVCDLGDEPGPDPERLTRAVVPTDAAAAVAVSRGDLNNRQAFRDLLRAAALRDGLSVVIGVDGPPSRRDVAALDRTMAEADQLGFVPLQRAIWSADAACDVRPAAPEVMVERGLERGANPVRNELTVEVLQNVASARLELRVRPLLEQVEVIRSKPPRPAELEPGRTRPGLPRVLHAEAGRWRAHLAGWRGEAPGLAAWVLCEAGRAMGYRVQASFQTTPVGPGRRAWSQVLFTRLQAGEAALTAQTPYGEADLLLGMDAVETLRSLGPDPFLRVADRDRTYVVANSGPLDDQVDEARTRAAMELTEAVRLAARGPDAWVRDVATLARRTFLTDRLTDLVLLGVAFQRGVIPVSVQALEAAVRRAEARGFGRCLEAMQFGRVLGAATADPAGEGGHDPDHPVALARRFLLEISHSGLAGARAAARLRPLFGQLLRRTTAWRRDPALRPAQRDLVNGLHRCWLWGAASYAEAYARLLDALLPVGNLAAWAALPLAEAMLIRDSIFVATMCTSPEQRRLTRRRLDVRPGRGDRMERRFLYRVEATLLGRFVRLDFRSSDWPARLLRLLSHVLPHGVRGRPPARDLRDAVVELCARAAAEPAMATAFESAIRRLHAAAEAGSLHGMPAEEVRAMTAAAMRGEMPTS
jgi:Pyruvate/2-oxoacid:ferredoxin oxidoreductase gamma subunit